jgi:hypothetical protein
VHLNPAAQDGRMKANPRTTAAVVVASLAAGCGGGVFIGIGGGDDFGDGRDPVVSIAVAQTSVPPGGTLRVVAAASDADGIDSVSFYRRDGGRWVRLADDLREPYEQDLDVPADGRSLIEVFARAFDRSGRSGDSNVVGVPVR